ncbi:MAG: substrate-binding domain-containing protein [Proteobacteria bacterium]|nr:substrate-binding domain-containing protein [Pseudomonadota bacterium]
MSIGAIRAGIFAAAGIAAIAVAGAALASEVTLRAKNGDFQIKGELVSYDKIKYTIMSASLGSMSLDASRFDCVDGGCPNDTVAMRTEAPAADAPAGPLSISISGSNTIGNQLMPNLIEAYADAAKKKLTKVVSADALDVEFRVSGQDGHDGGAIALHRHGSATAFTDLEKKAAQIGMASRPVKADEVQKLMSAGMGDFRQPGSEHVLGLDGLLVLVSPQNPIISLPEDAIAKIFSGQIADWAQLGQPAGKINVYAPTKESGTFDTFDNLVLKPNKLELTPTAKRTANHAEQADWVAHDAMGIGFTGIAYQRNAKALNIVSSCGLIAQPSTFSIKTEEYPLSRRLFLYTNGEPRDPVARDLLAFALSPEAQPIVKRSDFIDQIPEAASYDSQAARIAFALNAQPENFDSVLMNTFINDVKSSERLSVTFRFQSGSYQLDSKAMADAKRLVELLKTEPYKNKSVLLAGFADTKGTFSVNQTLSRHRAKAVLEVMKAVGLLPGQGKIAVKGYSELAPAACNDTADGMQLNRRVEVWVN